MKLRALVWWWSTIFRTRPYFGLLLGCFTGIPITNTILQFFFVYFANVIYSSCSFRNPFALMNVLFAKFRHAHCNAIWQCLGCQTPMKCIRCQGVPYAEAMQGGSLLRCSNVMFLHNKCPTRPPYPCIHLPLCKAQFPAFSGAALSVHCSTADCTLLTAGASTSLVQTLRSSTNILMTC